MCHAETLADFTRGWDGIPTRGLETTLESALRAFGCAQLDKMRRAGVRVWPVPYDFPPEYRPYAHFEGRGQQQPTALVSINPRPGADAAYLPALRLIDVYRQPTVYKLVHEIAHAWCDVCMERNPRRIDASGDAGIRAEIQSLARRQASGSTWETYFRRSSRGARSLQQIYDAYLRTVQHAPRGPMDHFGLSGDDGRYDRTDVLEVYAEGYAVFHSSHAFNQAVMQVLAPDLYSFLETEARQYQPPVNPDPERVAAERRMLPGGRR